MPTETLQLMVDGGKATPGPAVAQRIGPLGINMKDVMDKINEKTADFKGMQVPVTLTVDTKAKEVTNIEVGTPPTTQLIKKELGLEKGSGQPDKEKVENVSVEQCIKVAKMKMGNMYTSDLKSAVRSVAGSCNSLGVLIEGKTSDEFTKDLDSGKYDNEIKEGKTEASDEKKEVLKKQLEEAKEKFMKEAAKKKSVEEKTGEGKKEEKKGEGAEEEEKKEEKPGEEKSKDKKEEKGKKETKKKK